MTSNPYLANDKYSASLRTTWISSPADTSLSVNAIPTNVPTIIVVGWETDYETIFSVTGTSGTNSSNYALTGVVRIKGANINLPEGLTVNCLNNEEYFNQYGTMIAEVQATATAAQAAIDDLQSSIDTSGATVIMQKAFAEKVVTLSDGATPALDASLGNNFILVAGGNREIAVPTNPTAGQKIILQHVASGAARTLSLNTATGGFLFGSDITSIAETASGKTDVIGFQYVTANSLNKWLVLAQVQGF